MLSLEITCSTTNYSIPSSSSPRLDQSRSSKPRLWSTDFTCHGRWTEELRPGEGGGGREEGLSLSPTLASLVDPSAADRPFGSEGGESSAYGRRRQRQRHLLVLSTEPAPSQVRIESVGFSIDLLILGLLSLQTDNSLSARRFLCVSYEEREDGVLLAEAGSCSPGDSSNSPASSFARGARDHHFQSDQQQRQLHSPSHPGRFNITSSGPCLQALTGRAGAAPAPARWLQGFLAGVLILLAVSKF